MPTDSTAQRNTGGTNPWPLVRRLGLELAVVFVGVYAAFALSEYENAQARSTH